MSIKTPPPGRDFQDLVAAIERSLAPLDHTITSPMRVPDHDSGQLREHDVVVDIRSGRHPFRIAIEARDRGRKVGSGDVEGFRAKCERTGIDRAIIVSSRGFTEPALKKANADNIGCQTLKSTQAFDWCGAADIAKYRHDAIGAPHFHLDIGEDFTGGPAEVLGPDGAPWSKEAQQATANAWLSEIPIEDADADGSVQTRKIRCEDTKLTVVHPDGRHLAVRSVTATLSYRVSKDTVPIRFHSYRTEAGAEVQCDVASADIGGIVGRMVMTREADGTTLVRLVGGKA
jgi:hypothetical protein